MATAAASSFNMSQNASIGPSGELINIVPSDTDDMTCCIRQLYVGVAGNVTVRAPGGATFTFKNVPAGSFIGPFQVARVTAAGTTCTDMIGFV